MKLLNSGPGTGLGRGVYGNSTTSFLIQGAQVFRQGVLLGAVNALVDYPYFWFNDTQGNPSYTYFSNGDAGYTCTSLGTFAAISNVNYPAFTVPGSAYLDGTLYVMDASARIWGSNLNDPTTWSALNVIQAQIEPDRGVAIAKQLIYVVALKETSTEFFYDAANPVGTPLLPVQNAKIGYGCAYPLSVQNIDDVLFWIAKTKEGGLLVGECRGMKFQKISTPAIDRLLASVPVNAQVTSMSMRLNEHTYYVIRLPSNFSTPNLFLVYDATERLWYQWNNPLGLLVSTAYPQAGNGPSVAAMQGTDGSVYNIPQGQVAYYDTAVGLVNFPIVTEIITPNFSAGTKIVKVMSRLKFLADQNAGGMLQVRWSDDDYKNWSAWRTVNLAEDFPQLANLGSFRKRALHLRHSSPTPFRLQALELDVLLGSV